MPDPNRTPTNADLIAQAIEPKIGSTQAPAEPIMQFFAYEHLSPTLQAVSKPFCDLARTIVASHEMRKLLEAKDAAVRAALAK